MKNFTRTILLVLISAGAFAQDPHFSQFYYSPLTINPALTGLMNGSARVGIQYRSQWGSITAPNVYSTPSLFADFQFMRGRFRGNSLGAGLLILNDVAGDADYSTMDVMGSLSYHQSLDGTNNYHLSFGIQGGFTQNGVDATKMIFGTQFNGDGFDQTIDPHESLVNSIVYPGVSAGIAFSGQLSKYSQMSLGVSAFHMNKPQQSIQKKNQPVNEVYIRYVAHGNSTIGFNNKIYLFPAAMYEFQGPSKEFVGGMAFGMNFTENRRRIGTILYIGSFARYNESLIATLGMITKQIKCGISYDITTSTLANATNGLGGFEIALVYNNLVQAKQMRKVYCPRF